MRAVPPSLVRLTREGKLSGSRGGFGPYQIGYDAIVPKRSECENLFVTFALSASHTAFASIRLEPVFLIASQSAATASCMAMNNSIPVQALDYEKLQASLLKDGQALEWKYETPQNARPSTAKPSY